jgi:predicted dehydrogenase
MYGIGMIGLGIMGRRMLGAMEPDPRFRVVCGFDPRRPDDLPSVPFEDSAAAVANDPAVDCVYIASPPAFHAEHVAVAAAAGKAIFCEKPLASSVAEARACVEALRGAGVPGAVNFPLATAPAPVRLRELARKGELGEVRAAHLTLRFARWPREWQEGAAGWLAGPEQGGFLREVGSHFLFLAHRLFGPGELREATVERGPAGSEIAVRATVGYGVVTLSIDGAVAGDVGDHNRFEVVGSRDKAVLSDWYRLDHAGAVTASERPRSLTGQLDGLARLLAGDPDQPLATFEEAAAVVELVEGILARGSV